MCSHDRSHGHSDTHYVLWYPILMPLAASSLIRIPVKRPDCARHRQAIKSPALIKLPLQSAQFLSLARPST